MSLFPLSIYWSMRRFGFSRLQAAFGGLASCLIATNGLYGLEYGSYVWRGNGMTRSLWGMFLLPFALAQCYVTLREGRGYFWAVLLVAATVLSHACPATWRSARRPVGAAGAPGRSGAESPGDAILAQRGAADPAAAPVGRWSLLLPGPVRAGWRLHEPERLGAPGKYDSYGAAWVLGALAKGQLLDYGRFPSLTLLAAAGLVICLWRRPRAALSRPRGADAPLAAALFRPAHMGRAAGPAAHEPRSPSAPADHGVSPGRHVPDRHRLGAPWSWGLPAGPPHLARAHRPDRAPALPRLPGAGRLSGPEPAWMAGARPRTPRRRKTWRRWKRQSPRSTGPSLCRAEDEVGEETTKSARCPCTPCLPGPGWMSWASCTSRSRSTRMSCPSSMTPCSNNSTYTISGMSSRPTV